MRGNKRSYELSESALPALLAILMTKPYSEGGEALPPTNVVKQMPGIRARNSIWQFKNAPVLLMILSYQYFWVSQFKARCQ